MEADTIQYTCPSMWNDEYQFTLFDYGFEAHSRKLLALTGPFIAIAHTYPTVEMQLIISDLHIADQIRVT